MTLYPVCARKCAWRFVCDGVEASTTREACPPSPHGRMLLHQVVVDEGGEFCRFNHAFTGQQELAVREEMGCGIGFEGMGFLISRHRPGTCILACRS